MKYASASPSQVTARPIAAAQREPEPDAGGQLLGRGGGRDEQGEDEQDAGDLRRRRDRQAEHEQEGRVEQPHRDAARLARGRVDGRVEQRPPGRDEEHERRRPRRRAASAPGPA